MATKTKKKSAKMSIAEEKKFEKIKKDMLSGEVYTWEDDKKNFGFLNFRSGLKMIERREKTPFSDFSVVF